MVVASLILMFGLTMLALGLYFNEPDTILEIVKSVFEPGIAGL